MSTVIQDTTNTCTITNLSISDLLIIHSSLSHQVIDISRHMRHNNITCEAHNSFISEMTRIQNIIHKVGLVIESRKTVTSCKEN